MIASALGLLGVGALGVHELRRAVSGHDVAVGDGVTGPTLPPAIPDVAASATATEVADRWRLDSGLVFPVATGDDINVLNNFGADSQSLGPCAHNGIDIFRADARPGQPLVACADGVLVGQRLADGAPMGNAWILVDANGDAYRYHHLDSFEDGLAEGSFVRRGQVIGYMGSSGNPSAAGPHLHFEVRRGGPTGTAVDPVPLLPIPAPGVNVGPKTGCRR